jgi:hypothetical protein
VVRGPDNQLGEAENRRERRKPASRSCKANARPGCLHIRHMSADAAHRRVFGRIFEVRLGKRGFGSIRLKRLEDQVFHDIRRGSGSEEDRQPGEREENVLASEMSHARSQAAAKNLSLLYPMSSQQAIFPVSFPDHARGSSNPSLLVTVPDGGLQSPHWRRRASSCVHRR